MSKGWLNTSYKWVEQWYYGKTRQKGSIYSEQFVGLHAVPLGPSFPSNPPVSSSHIAEGELERTACFKGESEGCEEGSFDIRPATKQAKVFSWFLILQWIGDD